MSLLIQSSPRLFESNFSIFESDQSVNNYCAEEISVDEIISFSKSNFKSSNQSRSIPCIDTSLFEKLELSSICNKRKLSETNIHYDDKNECKKACSDNECRPPAANLFSSSTTVFDSFLTIEDLCKKVEESLGLLDRCVFEFKKASFLWSVFYMASDGVAEFDIQICESSKSGQYAVYLVFIRGEYSIFESAFENIMDFVNELPSISCSLFSDPSLMLYSTSSTAKESLLGVSDMILKLPTRLALVDMDNLQNSLVFLCSVLDSVHDAVSLKALSDSCRLLSALLYLVGTLSDVDCDLMPSHGLILAYGLRCLLKMMSIGKSKDGAGLLNSGNRQFLRNYLVNLRSKLNSVRSESLLAKEYMTQIEELIGSK